MEDSEPYTVADLEIFCVISSFCATSVAQNEEIMRKIRSSASDAQTEYIWLRDWDGTWLVDQKGM